MLRKKSALIVILLALVFGSAGVVKAAMESQARYNQEGFHKIHDENKVACKICHLQSSYESLSWATEDEGEIGGPSIGSAVMPQNLSRKVDKTECRGCHRWGADTKKAFYGSPSAGAGDLYKKKKGR